MNSPALKEPTQPQADALGGQINSASAGDLRLNLGGMGEGFLLGKLPGFKTMDLREGADIQGDCSDLSRFASESVDAIYASNILEHWPIDRTVGVLKEWARVLKPQGKMYISVPDFDAAVNLYQKIGLTKWLKYHLWGDQKHALNYHYVCFTMASLSKDLLDAGFRDIKRVKLFNIGETDGSTNVNNVTLEPVSLNVIATK